MAPPEVVAAEAAPAVPEQGSVLDAVLPPLANIGKDVLKTQIDTLKAEQSSMKQRRMKLAKDLRNAERRRQRLKRKAKQLSDDDLLTVLRMRRGAIDATSTTAASSSSSSSSSSTGAASSSSANNPDVVAVDGSQRDEEVSEDREI